MNLQQSISLLLCSMGLYFPVLTAQHAVLTSGGDAGGISGSAAYSVGEVAYTKFEGETGSVSLGVQQSFMVTMVGTEESDISLFADVYPNPVQYDLSLELMNQNQEEIFRELSYSLYDVQGRLLRKEKIRSSSINISMEHLAPAVYILKITRELEDIKSFKIFKTN